MASMKRQTKRQRTQVNREQEQVFDRKFAMKTIAPKTETQETLFDEYNKGQNIVAVGSAGSGKTYVSLYLALQEVLEKEEYEKVLLVRSAVQSRDQGFMPGSQKEKEAHYEIPFIDIVNDLFGRGDAYATLKQRGAIDFKSTSFIRGLTFNNTIVIVDELQNMSWEEAATICGRIGYNSKIILCGDTKQDDLKHSRNKQDVSGFKKLVAVAELMKSFSVIEFTPEDIVRSGFVKEFILAEMEFDNN